MCAWVGALGAAECAALKCLIYLCKQHINTVSRGKANVAAMIYVLQEDVSIGFFCLVTCRMLICKEQGWSLMLNRGKAFSEAICCKICSYTTLAQYNMHLFRWVSKLVPLFAIAYGKVLCKQSLE